MKQTRVLLAPILVLTIFSLSGCGGGSNAGSLQDNQLKLLSKTWTVSNVMYNGSDVTKTSAWDWTKFALTISGTAGQGSTGVYQYAVTDRPNPGTDPWKPSGTWVFGTDPATQVVRDTGTDQVGMTYHIDASGKILQISFTLDTSNKGYRVSSVSGTWQFNLKNP